MIKKIIGLAVLLIVIAIGAGVYYLDSLVERGIEVAGSRVLATEVAVESVSLSPLSGSGSISGLTIRNPQGFSSEYAFQLGEVSVALNLGSLTSDLIEVDSVIIDSPLITYETDIRNDNIRALLANIGGGSDTTPEQEATSAPGPDILIRDFQMLSPRLDLVTAVASAPVSMPDIRMTDIGTGSGGVTSAELIRLILARVNRAIIEGNFPGVDALRQQAEDRLREVEDEARSRVDEAVQDLGNSLRDILNQ